MAKKVDEAVTDLSGGFHEAAADALALANDDDLLHHLETEGTAVMGSRFAAMMRFKPGYQQMRFLDARGMERVRVQANGQGIVRVPDKDLQDKSDRDYFVEAMQLPAGAVRLSRLDLNIEHGIVEVPHNPTLRFSAPVFAADGQRVGVVVINFGAATLLARLNVAPLPGEAGIALLNSRGSWLAGAEPARRWGDILNTSFGLHRERPAAWKRLAESAAADPDQWQMEGRYYARATLRPAALVGTDLSGTGSEVSSADPWWMAVSETEMSVIDQKANERLIIGGMIAALLLLLWGFGLIIWAQAKAQAAISAQQSRRLAQVVDQTSDTVVMTDADARINYVNRAFTEVSGYAPGEVIGRTPALLKSGHQGEAFYHRLWRDLKCGRPFRELFVNRRKDGELIYLQQSIAPLVDEDGRVTGYFSTGKDVTESRTTQLAFYDELTGLVNRSLFLDRLEHEIVNLARGGGKIAVLYMDLDGFKALNDSLGHAAGDQALKDFAGRIAPLVRKSDTSARIGGDEFVVLMREVDDVAAAERVAEQILAAMQTEWRAGDQVFSLGVSIGISLSDQTDTDGEKLLRQADAAMYVAKRGGRNRYAFYHPSMDKETA
jgi:diguanylate cyclase (GGDEF)-like protein/PAS domain S-box-containing protein